MTRSFPSTVDRPDEAANESLCLTCRFESDCVHRGRSPGPVRFCELFEEGQLKRDHITAIVHKHAHELGGLMTILEAIQTQYGHLPRGALELVARMTGCSPVDLYGMATFYGAFSIEPRGEHVCSVCVGTACHVRGARAVEEEFSARLGVAPGETTADRRFTLETVNCLGACALGPVAVVDGHYFPTVAASQVVEILERTAVGLDYVEVEHDRRVFPVEVCCARCNHSLMDPSHSIEGYSSIRVTISFERKHGWLRLSSLYGSYTIESEHEIPHDTVANFFCPYCHAELVGASDCAACSAPMVPLIVRGGGIIQICSRRGCRAHRLDLTGDTF